MDIKTSSSGANGGKEHLIQARETSHTHPIEHVAEALETRMDHGLPSEEAAVRLQVLGANELREAPRPTFLKMLLDQFNNFVVIILIVASVISAVMGDFVEAAVIMAI